MRLFWITANLIFLLDKITKYLLINSDFKKIEILPFLNIVKVWNPGIVFGIHFKLGGFWKLILIFITLLVMGFIYFWAKKIFSENQEDKLSLVSLGMIFGGGLGNLTDRIFYGKVFDFIDLHINNLHWPAFNISDMAITISLFLLIYKSFKPKKCFI